MPPAHPGPPPPDFPPIGGPPPGFAGMPIPPTAGILPFPPGMMPPEPPLPPGTPMADETFPGDTEEIAVAGLDPRWQADYHGLLYMGAIRGRFSWLGHSFVIRTLNTGQELICGQLSRDWQDTIVGPRAHAIAMVALCIELVDGRALPVPLGEDDAGSIGWAEARFRYVGRWYPFTVDHIFSRYLELEGRAKTVMVELGKGSAPEEQGQTSDSTSGSPSDEDS